MPALGQRVAVGHSRRLGDRGVVSAGVVGYALSSLLAPQRQYWHDVVCSTRLIDCRHDVPQDTHPEVAPSRAGDITGQNAAP